MSETDLSNSSVTKAPASGLSTFFSNPIIGVIGTLGTLVGIFLSIHFYNESKTEPSLTCYVNPARAALVRSGQASRLTALFNGKEVNSDITTAQIQIWNAGKGPIRRASILKPVVISTNDASPILEATVRTMSRDITGIALETGELARGRVTVTWDILERNDGGVIQLTYAGSPDTEFSVDGIVEGQKAPKYIYPGRAYSLSSPVLFVVSLVGALILGVLLTNLYQQLFVSWPSLGVPALLYTSKVWRRYLWAIIVLIILYSAFVWVWLFFLQGNPSAPMEVLPK